MSIRPGRVRARIPSVANRRKRFPANAVVCLSNGKIVNVYGFMIGNSEAGSEGYNLASCQPSRYTICDAGYDGRYLGRCSSEQEQWAWRMQRTSSCFACGWQRGMRTVRSWSATITRSHRRTAGRSSFSNLRRLRIVLPLCFRMRARLLAGICESIPNSVQTFEIEDSRRGHWGTQSAAGIELAFENQPRGIHVEKFCSSIAGWSDELELCCAGGERGCV
jgi:hypothetical protein